MTIIDEIRIMIKNRQYEFSKHAVDQSIVRDISVAELEDAIENQSELIGIIRMTSMARVVSSLVTRKEGARCIFSAAIRAGHL